MLEAAEIVERRFYEKHPPRAEYVLTDKGHDLAPIARTAALKVARDNGIFRDPVWD
jgi:DNA-binding HxlR family transcriptional regulator